jgi:hypothetical protein
VWAWTSSAVRRRSCVALWARVCLAWDVWCPPTGPPHPGAEAGEGGPVGRGEGAPTGPPHPGAEAGEGGPVGRGEGASDRPTRPEVAEAGEGGPVGRGEGAPDRPNRPEVAEAGEGGPVGRGEAAPDGPTPGGRAAPPRRAPPRRPSVVGDPERRTSSQLRRHCRTNGARAAGSAGTERQPPRHRRPQPQNALAARPTAHDASPSTPAPAASRPDVEGRLNHVRPGSALPRRPEQAADARPRPPRRRDLVAGRSPA